MLLLITICVLVLSIIGIVLVVVWGVAGSANGGHAFLSRADTVVSDQTLPLAGITEIDMEFSSESVEVLAADGDSDQIRVVQYSNRELDSRYAVKLSASSNTIRIRSGNRPFQLFMPFDGYQQRIEIYLPQSYNESLRTKLSSGDLTLSDRTLRTLDVRLTSGEIDMTDMRIDENASFELSSGSLRLEEISCENARLKATSGDLDISGFACRGEAQLDVASGSINAERFAAQSLRCDMTSGDIRFRSSDFTAIDAECSSGNIRIDTRTVPDSMNLSCTSGVINVKLPDNDGFTFEYQRTSGEIHSDFEFDNYYRENRTGRTHYQSADTDRVFRVNVSSGEIRLERG